ncbi:50S ribosomal protein 6, chloroplastic [Andrographis paniculata]|uniref:50S ribosomal protein 6, chloroplastic n=1 Tax=Andrographis paniculata TaxID=175694 RepID=UPI0021E6EF99|nr:50S ribosomal protein 6, chloroplastic [Andrographis paniculata]
MLSSLHELPPLKTAAATLSLGSVHTAATSAKMSVPAIFGVQLVIPATSSVGKSRPAVGGGSGLVIECSSRPQKKATQHHMKTRPRKTRPSDIRRRPAVYPPLPPLPPDWSFVSKSEESSAAESPQLVESE